MKDGGLCVEVNAHPSPKNKFDLRKYGIKTNLKYRAFLYPYIE